MNWDWSRALIVVGGAAAVAGAYCLLEATITPGHQTWLTGARATPLPTCLTRDFPTTFLLLFNPVTQQLTGLQIAEQLGRANGLVLSGVVSEGGSVSTLGIAVSGIVLLLVPLTLRVVFARKSKVRLGPTWDCGLKGLTPQMEYTATGFSKPIRMIFKTLFRPHREVQREYDYSPYFAKTIRFESHVEEIFEKRIYRPLNRAVLRFSRRMRALQAGSIQAYLIYIFITLLLLLLFAL